ncbi:hypothetical protein [Streptomyces sp. NPDC059176]|uniref:hypothetical protein n=1 Tax=Streptomyces sp. NPDC059176 TaxID=3346758 RepID=UPI003673A83A
MRPADQTEYIVQAIREGASMYEEDARRFLAEHDAHVRAEALREAAQSLEDSVPPAIAGPFTERERALLGTARTLRRLASSPSPAAGDKQPETEALCRCGHGKERHAPDVYGAGTCGDCPGDDERSWRHPYTPASKGGA